MNLKIHVIAFIAALVISPLSSVRGNLINDGEFDDPSASVILDLGAKHISYNSTTPVFLGGSQWYMGGNSDLPQSGSVTVVNQGIFTVLSPLTGDATPQYLVLNGLGVDLLTPQALGGISQDITGTTPGEQFLVTYSVGALEIGLGTSTPSPLGVGIKGGTITTPGGSLISVDIGTFQTESFTFTADASGTSTLEFFEPSLAIDAGGVAIDSVTVTAVPEPKDTMAILLGGGLLLLLVRRFKNQQVDA